MKAELELSGDKVTNFQRKGSLTSLYSLADKLKE